MHWSKIEKYKIPVLMIWNQKIYQKPSPSKEKTKIAENEQNV